ncbi:hypothetical protein [Nonomuraea sp. NPDC050310]|uniref:hypothetical protein n=1 Tax=unclassified Nonomuraea TaxID=2593643 RepID=UPI0034027AD1
MRLPLITLAAAATLTLTALPAAAATSSQPAAPGCNRPAVSNLDPGWGVMRGSYNLKKGPYSGKRCGTVTKLHQGAVLLFFCWTTNEYGKMWVHTGVKGTSLRGWMSLDNIKVTKTSGMPDCGLAKP